MAEYQAILDDDEKLTAVSNAVFEQVDANASGSIDKGELANAMTLVAQQAEVPPPSSDQVDAAFAELDTNADGVVSKDEFKVLVRAILSALAGA